jgi:hypothetical protein
MKPLLDRRRFLETTTSLIGLPALESLGFRRFASAAEQPRPKRLVFLGFGWGVTNDSWYPDATKPGRGYPLPPGLAPLERHQADFSIVQGLWHRHTANGHYGSTFWLTGANEFGQPGQAFHNTVSADQVAAGRLGAATRFDSLCLDCGEAAGGSGHGPGLSLSWDSRGKPLGGPRNPVEAFHKLFARDTTPLEQQQAKLAERKSVLDDALENARELGRQLGKADRAKLREYFDGIRDLERKLARDQKWLGVDRPQPQLAEPQPGLSGMEEIRMMYEILAVALETDSTRVITYRQPVSTLVTSLGIKVESHTMSHYHGHAGEKLEASQRRDLAQSELLAGLLDRLKATKEPDGSSLFDHTTVVYGSNIRTGHSLDNCPTLIAGGGAVLKLGENIVVPKGTPLCNAWLTILQSSGVDVPSFGDSTGILDPLVSTSAVNPG